MAGRNPVAEALSAGVPARSLRVAAGVEGDARVREVVRQAEGAGIPVRTVPRAALDRAAGGVPHQGVLLEVAPFDYAELPDVLAGAGPVVAVDGLTDPRNLGAIVRSAAAFGAAGVVLPARRAAGVSAAVWKASAGAVARLPVARVPNLTRALAAAADAGRTVAGLAADGSVTLDDLEVDEPVALVVGSEDRGLSRLVRERCDLVLRVPMAGPTESLNAAVAAAVVLAELARRRRVARFAPN